MAGRIWAAALVCAVCAGVACADVTKGLVAHYKMDEGMGRSLRDSGPKRLHGKIKGATWVTTEHGPALAFRGRAYVHCGKIKRLGLRQQASLSAWIQPKEPSEGEPVIVGHSATVCSLTYYSDGRVFMYMTGDGGMTVNAPAAPGKLYHVAGTFDGKVMKLYVNGELKATRELDRRYKVETGDTLRIGGGSGLTHSYKGTIDDVRIYKRALSDDEVKALHGARVKSGPSQTGAGEMIAGNGFVVQVTPHGGIAIQRGEEVFRVESSYSHPGETIGYNHLGAPSPTAERSWSPVVTRRGPAEVRVTAAGGFYSVEMTVKVAGERINIREKLTSRFAKDMGILIRHNVRTGGAAREPLFCGVPASQDLDVSATGFATNPTLFLSGRKSNLGVVAEDSLSRLQFEPFLSADQCGYRLDHFGLQPGKSRTLRWTVYSLEAEVDYYGFVNRVRQDWGVNYTIDGPFDFGPRPEVWRDPQRLKKYLKRKRLKIATPGPWLDYDNFDSTTGRLMTREKYKDFMRSATAAIKAADPEVKVVGNLEGPLVSLPHEVVEALYEALPPDQRTKGYPKPFTDRQLDIIKDMKVRQGDSLVRGPDGRTFYELYFRGPKGNYTPLIAILVYPAPGNGQMDFLMEQARYLMDDVGLDGVYLDGACPVRDGRYSYDKWDGVTVDMSPGTGEITRRYTDLSLVMGSESCPALFSDVLGRGKIMLANGHHYTEETESMPILRFHETGGSYDPLALGKGEKPPFLPFMHEYCHLSVPVALGNRIDSYGERGRNNYAKFVMKSVVIHLRHGLLYYYYGVDIPETGPGAGEYGPINHMYPFTPIEIHEGWLLGKERIITARSLENVLWEKAGKPVAHLFDMRGMEITGRTFATIARQGGKWSVSLKLEDWEEIAVVE